MTYRMESVKKISIVLVILGLVAWTEAVPRRRHTHTITTSKGTVQVEDLLEGVPRRNDTLSEGRAQNLEPLIVGGKLVKDINDFPQIVSIVIATSIDGQEDYFAFCTGAIIDDDIVHSAAHCFEDLPVSASYYVCAGTVDVYDLTGATCSRITHIWRPSLYDDESFFEGYDMAILKVAEKITGPRSKRVMVSFKRPVNNQDAISAGFGITRTNDGNGRMRYVTAKVQLNEGQCQLLNEVGLGDDSNLICARATKGAACSGDSGGPLLLTTGRHAEYINVGNLSFGVEGCPTEIDYVYTSLYDEDHANLFKYMVEEVANGEYLPDTHVSSPAPTPSPAVSSSPIPTASAAASSSPIPTASPESGDSPLPTGLPRPSSSPVEVPVEVACFPASAVVHASGGEELPMVAVVPGQSVLVGPGLYSDVFAFSHRLEGGMRPFVSIEAADRSIELSPGHYLWVSGSLQAANTVRVGDLLHLANGTAAAVTSVKTVRRMGLFNPHTLDGNIVVNGIVASTYTQAVEPRLAHALLWLPRLLYRLGVTNPLGSVLHKTAPSNLLRWIPRGAQIAEVALHSSCL